MSRFRELLYLDDDTVSRLLASANLEANLDAQKSPPDAERRFRQLWKAIMDDGDYIDSDTSTNASADSWENADEGTLCKLTGKLTVPPIIAALSAASELSGFLKLGQLTGLVPVSGDEAETLDKRSALQELIREQFPVLLTIGSTTNVALTLDVAKSKYPQADLQEQHRYMGAS